MTGVFCANGHPMGPGERFCGTCGAAAIGGAAPQPGYQQPAPQPGPSGGINPIIWVVVALIVAAAGVVIALLATGGDGDGTGTTAAGGTLPPLTQPTVAPTSSSSTSTSSSSSSTSTSTSSSTSTTSSTTTTTTIPGPDTLMTAEWHMRTGGDLAGAGGQHLYDVVATANGYVTVGLDGFSAVWTSPDAMTWTQHPLGAEFNGTQMTQIEKAPDGTLVGVGRRIGEPNVFTAWTSPDGLIWTQQPPATGELPGGHQGILGFEAFPGGFLAVGAVLDDSGESDAAWWTSPDGVTWTAHTIAEPGTQAMVGAAVADGTMVVLGQHGMEVGGWRADTGQDFVRITDPDLTLAVDDPDPAYADAQVFVWDVAATGPGFVAVGGSRMRQGFVDGAVWTSADGTDWVRYGNETGYQPNMMRANFTGFGDWTVMDTVLDSNGTTIVIGRTGAPTSPNIAVWQSPDGMTWEQGPVGIRATPQRVQRAIAIDNRIIAVGQDGAVDGTGDGAVWVAAGVPEAPVIGTWREVPVFEPAGVSSLENAHPVPDGAIAVGRLDTAAPTWETSDGAVWSRQPATTPPAGDPILDSITEIGGTYYATGFVAGPDPDIWWSTDLSDWQRANTPASLPGFLNGIVEIGGTFVAYGTENTFDRPIVWVSSDGRNWASTPAPLQFGAVHLRDLVAHDGRFLAVGEDGASNGTGIWTSTDGNTWTRLADHPAMAALNPFAVDVLDGVVMVAGEGTAGGTATASVLLSSDLQSWSQVPLAEDVFVIRMKNVEGRMFVAGEQFTDVSWHPVLWSTSDGMFWLRSDLYPIAGGPNDQLLEPGRPNDVTRVGDRYVAVGYHDRPDGSWYATAWTSDNP